ncbi:hypothetical protein DPMN_152423 [Dreissena polymorpha]|uniref:Uncharacterized protein n=1 Tax=Dreissena polymorpha TaxID=45954 RepID=A0A9D4FHF4_DREPO|nr:hypothetical protein DPMN_152423 [Dreissena polymorpha]
MSTRTLFLRRREVRVRGVSQQAGNGGGVGGQVSPSSSPNSKGMNPNSRGMSPNSNGSSQNSRGMSPNSKDSSSNSRGMSPNSKGMSPNSRDMSPNSKGTSPPGNTVRVKGSNRNKFPPNHQTRLSTGLAPMTRISCLTDSGVSQHWGSLNLPGHMIMAWLRVNPEQLQVRVSWEGVQVVLGEMGATVDVEKHATSPMES